MHIRFSDIQSEEMLLGLGFSFNQKEYSFASVHQTDVLITNTPNTLLKLSYGIDLSKVSYTRSVFHSGTILEMLEAY